MGHQGVPNQHHCHQWGQIGPMWAWAAVLGSHRLLSLAEGRPCKVNFNRLPWKSQFFESSTTGNQHFPDSFLTTKPCRNFPWGLCGQSQAEAEGTLKEQGLGFNVRAEGLAELGEKLAQQGTGIPYPLQFPELQAWQTMWLRERDPQGEAKAWQRGAGA